MRSKFFYLALLAESLCDSALAESIPLFPALSKDLPNDDWMSAETQYLQYIDPGPKYGGKYSFI